MSEATEMVNGAARPREAEGVTAVLVDGEAVLHHAGRVHALDPVATLVWRCCDGEASVDEIATELAAAFATPVETVRRDMGAALDELARQGLVTGVGAHASDPGASEGDAPDLLLHPPGSCASCADKRWARLVTFRVGSHHISVGTDDPAAEAAMRDVLADHLVAPSADELAASPFFAMTFVDSAPEHGPRDLSLLQRADTVVARSRRPDDVVRALLGHLATYTDLGPLGLAAVNGIVVARGGRAVIVPEPSDPIRYRHALARFDIQVADLPVALVDRSSFETVVGAPGLRLDDSALAALAATSAFEPGRGTTPLPWGRYRVVALGVAGRADASSALLRFGPVRGDHRDHDATFAALLALLDAVPVVDAVEPEAIDALLDRS